ncbi:MAG: hypothetical protein ABJB12_20775 [Pseudomonadota bacterium]
MNKLPPLAPPPRKHRLEILVHGDHSRKAFVAFRVLALQFLAVVLVHAQQRSEWTRVADPIAPTSTGDLALAHAREECDPNKGAAGHIDLLGQQRQHLATVIRLSRLALARERFLRQHAPVRRHDRAQVCVTEHRADRPKNVGNRLFAERPFLNVLHDLPLRAKLLNELQEMVGASVFHF